MSFEGKTVFVTGASRGIGLAIALKLAKLGANIAIAAKTTEPQPKLPGTIYTAADDIRKVGARCLPIKCDIRFENEIQNAIDLTVKEFGGIDILVNNASAISLTDTENTNVKRYDLMSQINGRGTWLTTKLALPYLKESAKLGRNPHVLVLSPPLDMRRINFESHVAYTIAKYSMSLCVLGFSGEFEDYGIAVNALWPKTSVETSAMKLIDSANMSKNRTVDIMADAAHVILSQPASFSGNFVIDEVILRLQGVTDFSKYRITADCKEEDLSLDFFLPPNLYDGAKVPPKQVIAKL